MPEPGLSSSPSFPERYPAAFSVPSTVTLRSRSIVSTVLPLSSCILRPFSPSRAIRHNGSDPPWSGSSVKTVAATPLLPAGNRRTPSEAVAVTFPSSCMLVTESISSANWSSVGLSPRWKYDFNVFLSLYLLSIVSCF